MAIQFKDGKILFVDGAIAMHEDCCCEDPCDCDWALPDTVTATLSGPIQITTCDSSTTTFTGPYTLTKGLRSECPCEYWLYEYPAEGPNIQLAWIPPLNRWRLYLQANDSYDCHTNSCNSGPSTACDPTGNYPINVTGASCSPCSRNTDVTAVVS